MSARLKVYAIGMKGGWVELRESTTPPKAQHTEIEKEIEVEVEPRYDYVMVNQVINGFNTVLFERRPIRGTGGKRKEQLKLANTIHTGGKVIGVIKANVLARIMGKRPRYGYHINLEGYLALTAAQAKLVRARLERG